MYSVPYLETKSVNHVHFKCLRRYELGHYPKTLLTHEFSPLLRQGQTWTIFFYRLMKIAKIFIYNVVHIKK